MKEISSRGYADMLSKNPRLSKHKIKLSYNDILYIRSLKKKKMFLYQVLLQHGGSKALLNVRDRRSSTPLHIASKKGFLEIIKVRSP